MWSARSGVPPRPRRGGPPRTNDIDNDEWRKTITGVEGGMKRLTHGLRYAI